MLETIKADERHKRLHVIHDQEIPKIGFKGWSVGFANMESIDKSKLEGNLDFLVKGYTYELAKADSTWGAQIIKTFAGMSLMLWISLVMKFGEEDGQGLAWPKNGVSDGAWTRDHSDHNRELYQLSYAHHFSVFTR